jgi:thiol-disulfide isomerase/thioredoxin
MRLFTIIALTLGTAGYASAQTSTDSIWVSPSSPHPGDKVTVYYQTIDPAYAKAKKLAGGFYTISKGTNFQAQDLDFRKVGSHYEASGVLSDTVATLVVNVRNAKGEPIIARAVGLVDASGNLLNEANNGLAFVYSGGGKQLYGVESDLDKYAQYQEQYYKNAPPTSFGDKLMVYSKLEKDTAKAFKEISNLPLDSSAKLIDYSKAIAFASKLKNKPLADLLTNIMHQKFPVDKDGKIRDYYAKLHAAKDVEEKEKIYAAFRKEFPDEDVCKPGTYSNAIRATVFEAVAETGDINRARQYGIPNATGTALAGENNTLAWQAALKGQSLQEATALSKASLDTLKAVEAADRERPGYFTPAQWKKNLDGLYGMYADTYAYLLDKQGDDKAAVQYETLAIRSMDDPETDVVAHYTTFLEKVEAPSKVLDTLKAYILKGKEDSTMDAQYKRLYKGPGTADDALAALNTKAKANKEAEMVRTILHDPAAHFTLTDLQGNKISLDSLKGKTVVLDFWATWCGPCKASFPAMQQLVTKYKDDKNVVFLFVDTWEHSTDTKQTTKDVGDFIKNNSYSFHVLMDLDDKVVGQYKVEGIPTKFVIDGNGVLRFKAVGYNDNLKATVDEVGDMIEVTKKS